MSKIILPKDTLITVRYVTRGGCTIKIEVYSDGNGGSYEKIPSLGS